MRKIRYGRTRCRGCGAMVTKNALGRARHSCQREIEKRKKEADAAAKRNAEARARREAALTKENA